jgi:hypothetical protein
MALAEFSPQSAYGQEMAKWNKPYTHQPFPKMLYRAKTDGSRITLSDSPSGEIAQGCTLVVNNEAEMRRAKDEGWREGPKEALEHQLALQKAVSDAAAERNFRDRNMGEKAKAESAAAEAEADGHLGEIPEQPVRRRGRARKNT